jgi:hypothetical protein
MITFTQARAAAAEKYGQTRGTGYEDTRDYVVDMVEPMFDAVVMVSKVTGEARPEVYFAVEARLDRMTPITSKEKTDS